MNADQETQKLIAADLTDAILGGFYAVYNEAQLVNYLKATGATVGLLLNFGTKPEFRRRVLSAPTRCA